MYKIPSEILFGNIEDITSSLLKGSRVLILTSPTVSRHPSVSDFLGKISEKINVVLITTIKPDAPICDLEQIVSENEKPDLILGIGGGSVIDSAKALSVCWQDTLLTDIFYGKGPMPITKIRVYAVPTTAGTGAELSYGAILYDKQNGVKGGIRGELLQPDKVLLDTRLYLSAPYKLIAEVGFDCLTHAIETYISTASTPLVRYQSITAINVVFNNLVKASTGNDVDAMEKMSIAALLMGVNLALSTTCLPHRIQYAIGPLTGTSHAQGLIVLYKGWLKEILETEQFKKLAYDLNLSVTDLIEKINALKQQLDIDYNLTSFGITCQNISDIASKVTGNLKNDPSYQSINTIVNILENSL